MTDHQLKEAWALKQARDKAFQNLTELQAAQDGFKEDLEKNFNVSNYKNGWLTIHVEDRDEVLKLAVQKAHARYLTAFKAYEEYLITENQ